MRKVSLSIAKSLDGYIAKPNDDLSFLKSVEKEGEDYGYAEFTANVDTIIPGRRTYDHVPGEIGPSYYDNGKCMSLQELQDRVLVRQYFTREN